MRSGRDVLLFDLDGTLVDSAHSVATALSGIRLARGAPPITAESVRPWISLGADALIRHALAEVAADPAEDLAAFRQILRALPADSAWLYPGVREVLSALAGEGFAMAVVTNKPEGLSRALLGDLGLLAHFGALVGGDTTPFPKPHRAPMEQALQLLGAPIERALLVGDSVIDASAARAMGMPFLLFSGGYGAEECHEAEVTARFSDFFALPKLIARLG